MRAFFGNFATASDNNTESRTFRFENNRRSERISRNGRRDFAAERRAFAEREAQTREAENLRITRMNEQIDGINGRIGYLNREIAEMQTGGATLDPDLLDEKTSEVARHQASIASITGQIAQIHMNRAEREQLAIEREFQRQKLEMEERMREREEAASVNYQNKTAEELEEAAERANIRNLTVMSARADNIASLRISRASMEASAARLRGEGDFDMRRQEIANAEIKSFVSAHNVRTLEEFRAGLDAGNLAPGASWRPMEIGHLFDRNPLADDGFRGRHLQNIEAGISRLNANIGTQIGAMYRDSQNMQEEQLRISREKSALPNSDDEDSNYTGFDLRL